MGLPWTTCLLLTGICTTLYAYKVKRSDDGKRQPLSLEIDYFSNEQSHKIFDELENKNVLDEKNIQMGDATTRPEEANPLDSWSVVWYIASFGGLIVFFLIVSCSEWCCRRAIRGGGICGRHSPAPNSAPNVPDTPPPSYDQFAPPSYESICLGRGEASGEKRDYDVYVVPVHTLPSLVESSRAGQDEAPPSYISVETGRVT